MKSTLLTFVMLVLLSIKNNAQTWQWVREEQAGPEGYGVACDNAGNAFLTGITNGTTAIGSFSTSFIGAGGVIVKYDPNGNVLWANFLRGCTAYNVACDASGNAFLCGYFSNTMTVGTQTFTAAGTGDIFVAKYSPGGALLWATSVGGPGGDLSSCITVDTQGDVIVSGYVGVGSFTFGSSSISNTSSTKYFLAKFSNNGTPIWASCGASGVSNSYYVSTDASDNIYLTGFFSSTSAIGSGTYVSSGQNDIYLAKFSPAGVPLWNVVGGGTATDIGYCVRVHSSGDIFVCGGFVSPTFSLAGATLPNVGGYDVFVARFSNTGSLLWAINGGGIGTEIAYSMATHPGGVYVAGSLNTPSFVMGTATLTPATASSDNMFFVGIDNAGNVAYSQDINGGGDDVMALDMYNGCSLYLGGDILTPTLTLGAFTVTHTTSEVLFIAKFNTGINSPTLNLSQSYTLCQGSTMTLTASGADTYTWTNGPNTNSFAVSPAVTSSYVIAGTSTAGCSTKSVVNVVVVPGATTLSVLSSTPFCAPSSATLSVLGASSHTWNTTATNSSIVVSPTSTSVYNVSGTMSTGCSYTNSYTLNVTSNMPVSAAALSSTICKGQTAKITASGASLYSWNTGPKQASISVSPTVSTNYVVTGTNSTNGCVTQATVQISVAPCTGIDETLDINSLTIFPNPGDGALQILTDKSFSAASVMITNLQGEVILRDHLTSQSYRISGLLPGVYILTIERPGLTKVSRKVLVE